MEGKPAVNRILNMSTRDLSKDLFMIDMRQSIDHFDASFLHLLSERMRVVRKIITLKQLLTLDLQQSNARKADMKELIEMSVQLKLEKHFFKKILDLVFQDAISQNTVDAEPETSQVSLIEAGKLSLDEMRGSLLNLDKSICFVLAERFCIVKRIGIYKEQLNIPPLDTTRWQQVLDDKAEKAKELGISVDLIKNIFNAIHEVALVLEEDVKTI